MTIYLSDAHKALEAMYGKLWADSIVRTLEHNNYIIVRKGAIGEAQREAVRQYVEDARYPAVVQAREEADKKLNTLRKAVEMSDARLNRHGY